MRERNRVYQPSTLQGETRQSQGALLEGDTVAIHLFQQGFFFLGIFCASVASEARISHALDVTQQTPGESWGTVGHPRGQVRPIQPEGTTASARGQCGCCVGSTIPAPALLEQELMPPCPASLPASLNDSLQALFGDLPLPFSQTMRSGWSSIPGQHTSLSLHLPGHGVGVWPA